MSQTSPVTRRRHRLGAHAWYAGTPRCATVRHGTHGTQDGRFECGLPYAPSLTPEGGRYGGRLCLQRGDLRRASALLKPPAAAAALALALGTEALLEQLRRHRRRLARSITRARGVDQEGPTRTCHTGGGRAAAER